MTENTSEKSNVLSDATVRNLREARTRMLRLHKILLDMERADFERESGPLTSGALLHLVINHEQFAWLRKLSAMVVQIDELLDAKDPALPDDLNNVLSQARSLFGLSDDEVFREKYQAALQRNPEAVIAHSEVVSLLKDNEQSTPDSKS